MRFLLLVVLSLSAADNRKSEPMDIPKVPLSNDQRYAAELFKVTVENDTFKIKQQRSIYLKQMKEKKYSADDLKKSGELIAAANNKYIYTNPEFTSKDEDKDK